MTEENIDKLKQDFAQFQEKFFNINMSLIAKMAEITEKLDRITACVDMVDKLRIQHSENKQIMKQVISGYTNLNRRLNSMSKNGFEIPEAETKTTEESAAEGASLVGLDSLDMKFESSEEETDDLSDLGDIPTIEDIQKQFGTKFDTNAGNAGNLGNVNPGVQTGSPTSMPGSAPAKTPAAAPNTTLTNTPASPIIANEEEKQYIQNPKSLAELLYNLRIDVKNANLVSHIGTLIVQTKEKMTKIKPFNKIYFEMIKYGGPLRNQGNAPNNPEVIEQTLKKIDEWEKML